MKKILTLTAAVFAAALLSAQAKLKVGATPVPHAEMLNLVKDDLKAQGVDIQVIEMTDYVISLRAATQGRGSLDFEFIRYDEVPSSLTDKIISEANAANK